ncbi:MAG: hypothetical protein JWM10_2754 [Myxococcaceae bacterium]|nr:hypothetical protein [Myxococcaceae bacterium]
MREVEGPNRWRFTGPIMSALLLCACGLDRAGDPPGDAPPGTGRSAEPAPGIGGRTLGALLRPVRTPDAPPPPISGGTLLIARDGRTAVAADPDRDVVWVADVVAPAVLGRVDLLRRDEPGRSVEDGARRVHVVLRGGGAIATIDLAARALVERRPVCPAPRGVGYDPSADVLHVACAGGELVTLPAAGGAPTRVLQLGRDLRDVVVRDGRVLVSRFRSAELLTVGPDGTVAARETPAVFESFGAGADVAWRTSATPAGVLMLHQRAGSRPVGRSPGAYGGPAVRGCRAGIVSSVVSPLGGPAARVGLPMDAVTLAVDFAVAPGGDTLIVAAPGNAAFDELSQVLRFFAGAPTENDRRNGCVSGTGIPPIRGQAVAVAYAGYRYVVQTREPASLWIEAVDAPLVLAVDSREDTGHRLFHSNAGAFIACASCHPEGGDDGHTWTFDAIGARRTQSLHGGLVGTAPFHWSGEMAAFDDLLRDVFAGRMLGGPLDPAQSAALLRWLDRQRPPRASPAPDPGAVARGEARFRDPAVGCATCHSGPQLTNNATVDVGTGGAFQVPSLVGVAWRTPLLHDGCAATLADRFGPCGGDRHGQTSQLRPPQIADLVAYLETL